MSPLRWALSPRLLAYLWIEKKRLCSAGHCNVFVSELLRDETRAALPTLSSAWVIAPGVSLTSSAPTPAEQAAARRKLGLAEDKLVIGFVGHDFDKKGLASLLRAVAMLPKDAQVAVIGRPTQAQRYADAVKALGPGKACRFLGVMRDMTQAYTAMDCLAHPTTQDVFPMVLLEAMAHRVPVVTTMAPYNSMADLLTDRVNAMLVPDPQDHAALADALKQVCRQADLRQRLVEGGLQFARQYSWSEVKKRYYEVYRTAMAKRA